MGHIHEKIDFTTTVYIVHDNKILLHKHRILKMWLPPGGHIELDEDPNEGAIREAKEESGLDVKLVGEITEYGTDARARDLVPPKFLNKHFYDETRTHIHVDFCFFATCESADARPEDEGGEIRWFTKEEVEGGEYEIVADVKRHALVALEELAE